LRACPLSSRAPSPGGAVRLILAVAVVMTALASAPSASAAARPTNAFHAVSARLLDTRDGHRLRAGDTVEVAAAGRARMPDDVAAVVLNVTATATGGPGFVTAYPSGAVRPTTSVLNAEGTGETLANLTTVRVGAHGSVTIFASMATDITVDVFGYYTAATTATAGRFVPVGPERAFDTRPGHSPVAPGGTARVEFSDIVPRGITAVVATFTVTNATAPGFWTAWPVGAPRPATSNVNVAVAGQTVANEVVVPVAADGIDVFSQAGGDLIVDVTGYFTGAAAPSSAVGLFVPIDPTRALDTRTADLNPLGNAAQPQAGWTVEVPMSGYAAVAANVTLVHALQPGYVTAYPAGTARPEASSLNASVSHQTIANHIIMPLGARGLAVYTQRGGDLLVDVTGYFTGTPQASRLPPEARPAPPAPNRIVIAAAGVSLPVGYGIDPATLAVGPGYWPGFGQLGQPGNVLVGAHRASHGSPFEQIDQIKAGDDIWLFADGARYHYVATDHFIVNANQAEPVVRQTAAHELTLFACHPPGSEDQRYIVRAIEVRD
jgi:LPXTG-site transpeptidase (sortase) family protein